MADYIEGKRPIIEALRTDVPLKKILLGDYVKHDPMIEDILRKARQRSIQVILVSRNELDEKSARESHQGVSTAHMRADFHHTFATHYVLGAEAEAYQTWLGGSAQTARSNELNFSFGIYLRINPQFKIKKF